ncbi:anaerobic sulfatase maturase [Uliginosibacterium sp. sgz301328]|uniref:anaerobic sulfatase maturase n=1 Tax=Uliginosibacterium sp. sgz301328 TaxID=3243764 RepID=UPI00359DCC19
MAKPCGSDCNLHCAYCYYLERAALYPDGARHRMSDEILEQYVVDYIGAIHEDEEVAFTWQGGEPTLQGLDFYRRAVALQAEHGRGRHITNSFQTNGLLIDEDWCSFLAEHDFLVGLSLDGPAAIHDEYRVTRGGNPSHDLVLRALRLLQKHGVRYNVLACVNRRSATEPLEVYRFLRDAGARYIQFLPVVERTQPTVGSTAKIQLAPPPAGSAHDLPQREGLVTPWSVGPADYGHFLNAIFDEWIKRDVGRVFVMNIEWALANYMDRPGAVCHHRPTCGRSLVMEHNGDVYACDHYAYPDYLLGNITNQPLSAMADAPSQEQFGRDKFALLPDECRRCKVLKACWGGCPRHRFIPTDDSRRLNYLCVGLRRFFEHVTPYMAGMSRLLAQGRPASDIMQATLVFQKPR